MSRENQAKPAGVTRRLGATAYDALLIVAVLMIATIPFVPFSDGKVLVPQEVGWLAYVYRLWLLLIVALFFGFFWTRRGQTVGMRAWRVRLENEQGELLTWPHALRRLLFSVVPWLPSLMVLSVAEHLKSTGWRDAGLGLLGLGFVSLVSLWFDPSHRTWYDRLTRSRVVALPKRR